MVIDFKVYKFDYVKRDGNLDAEAKGKVKSQKFFPYFYQDGKKIIFKPLSKTKPFSTPYFAYSEVVWSTLLNHYFDKGIPIYHLAKCIGYEEEIPKYHNYGTIVESIISGNEKLVNLYEYFENNPDCNVNIKNYINYCLKFYDYSFFFESKLFLENEHLAEEVAKQILYSILRADQNYHYENVSLVFENGKYKRVAKPIDYEFSTMFMYLDQEIKHMALYGKYINQLEDNLLIGNSEEREILYKLLDEKQKYEFKSKILKNIEVIVKRYPNLVQKFMDQLIKMISDLSDNPINLEDNNFIEPFNSDDFEEGILRYKENRIEEADKLSIDIEKKMVNVKKINLCLNQEIVTTSETLYRALKKKL